MNSNKLRFVLVLIIIIGLAASVYIGIKRHVVEKQNKYVDLTIDYEDFKDTVGAWDMEKALDILKDSGITSIAIPEVNLNSLMQEGRILVLSGGELLQRERPGIDKTNINTNSTYIFVSESKDFENLSYELISRFTDKRVETKEAEGDRLIILKYPLSQGLREMEMGLDMDAFDHIKNAGLNIIPRIKNNHYFTDEYIKNLFIKLEDYPISAIIFVGDEVLGYPDNLNITGDCLNQFDIPFGLIESITGPSSNLKQAGMEKLAKITHYNTTRVFSLSEKEMKALPPKEIIDKWSRSFERNNRIIYMRMKSKYNGIYPEETIAQFSDSIKELNNRVTKMGYETGRVNPMEPLYISKFALILVSLGATAGGIMLLNRFIPFKETAQIVIFLLFFLPITGLLFTRFWILDILIVALASSIIFPSLSIIALIDNLKIYRNKSSVLLYVKTIGITMIGALYTAAMLTDTRFFLKLDSFRGVKIAFTLPLLLICVYYIGRYGTGERVSQEQDFSDFIKNIMEFIEYHVKVKHLILLTVAAAAAAVYILRSGNLPGIGVSSLEAGMRTFLEQVFTARPRTKEFLIGHPLLILLVGVKMIPILEKYIPFLALGASVGQISIVNTFSHLHIPIITSVCRTVYGIIIGLILGLILLILVKGAAVIVDNKRKEHVNG